MSSPAELAAVVRDGLAEYEWNMSEVDAAEAALAELVALAERAEAAETERDGWKRCAVMGTPPPQTAAEARVAVLEPVKVAAKDLYERVQMDESVGVCLSSRVETLILGDALAAAGVSGSEEERK